MSDESIKLPSTSENSLASSLNDIGVRPRTKFDSACLKQDKVLNIAYDICGHIHTVLILSEVIIYLELLS